MHGAGAARLRVDRETIQTLQARVKNLLNLMVDDEIPVDVGKAEIKTLDTRRNELRTLLETADEPPPLLHPEMATLYRQKVATLAQALECAERRTEAREAIPGPIDAIVMTPAEGSLRIELKGNPPRSDRTKQEDPRNRGPLAASVLPET